MRPTSSLCRGSHCHIRHYTRSSESKLISLFPTARMLAITHLRQFHGKCPRVSFHQGESKLSVIIQRRTDLMPNAQQEHVPEIQQTKLMCRLRLVGWLIFKSNDLKEQMERVVAPDRTEMRLLHKGLIMNNFFLLNLSNEVRFAECVRKVASNHRAYRCLVDNSYLLIARQLFFSTSTHLNQVKVATRCNCERPTMFILL